MFGFLIFSYTLRAVCKLSDFSSVFNYFFSILRFYFLFIPSVSPNILLPKKRLNLLRRVIHNYRKCPHLENISISSDKAPRKLNYYLSVKVVLVNRKNNGEPNIRIKYEMGISKCIPLNYPNEFS